MQPDNRITYYIIPYEIYSGAEIFLENHIRAGTFKYLHLLFPADNPLKQKLSGIVPCTGFARPALLKKFLINMRAECAAFHNSFAVYQLLQSLKEETGLHITEVVHSSLQWPDSMHQVDRRQIDRIYVTAPEVAREAGISDYEVLPPVIDEKRFQVPRRPQPKITVGTVASFEKHKNLTRIVDIARHTDDDFHFVIVGRGTATRPAVEKRIADYQLADKITLKEFTPAVEQEYATFDVFLLTSLVEGTPIVIEEAVSAGLPVVTAISGGIEQQMKGRDGHLFPLEDADEAIARQVMKWGRRSRQQLQSRPVPDIPPPPQSGPNLYLGPSVRPRPRPDYRPLISFYTPAYNAARFLRQAVDSVLHQTYDRVEICICDDGSTDETLAVLEENYRDDPRVRWSSQANSGTHAASAAAIGLSRGDLLAQLDADDWLDPTAAAEVVAVFREHPEAGLVYTGFREVDENGRPLRISRPLQFDHNIMLLEMIVCHLRVFRRDIYDLTRGFEITYRHSAQDYDISLKLLEYTRCFHLPRPLYNYRQHGQSITSGCRTYKTTSVQIAIQNALHRRCLPYTARRSHPESIRMQLFFDPEKLEKTTVSVVVLVQNQPAARPLTKILEDLCRQTHPPVEVLAAGRISAGEAAAIRTWRSGAPFSCRLMPDSGAMTREEMLGRAFQEATGDFIALQPSDQISHPDRLRCQLRDLTHVNKLFMLSGRPAPLPRASIPCRRLLEKGEQPDRTNTMAEAIMIHRPIARLYHADNLIEGILGRLGPGSIVVTNTPLFTPATAYSSAAIS
ncbi:MAG: glycosyltransferase [Desulfosudaceae bacterium]